MEFAHQGRAALLPADQALLGGQSVDPALDLEQGIDALHGLEGNRIDRLSALAPRFPACRVLDVRKFEEFTPGMGEAAGFEHGRRLATCSLELAVAAISVRLQDPRPGGEMRPGMFAAPVARVVEQRRRGIGAGERSVVAYIGP